MTITFSHTIHSYLRNAKRYKMSQLKVTTLYETFKVTYYKNDPDGVVVFYRKNSNGEFHRVIKINKRDLFELASSIKGNDNEI